MGFESKVASVKKIKVNILEILFVSMRACFREDVIIFSRKQSALAADVCENKTETLDKAERYSDSHKT